jgi:CO/xanthine dehydrogenase FAD-binding subunit
LEVVVIAVRDREDFRPSLATISSAGVHANNRAFKSRCVEMFAASKAFRKSRAQSNLRAKELTRRKYDRVAHPICGAH